jgi:hypothetical protein
MSGEVEIALHPVVEAGHKGETLSWLGARRTLARLLARLLRVTPCGWDDLDAELDRCAAPIQFWWRDDDAVAATPALSTLLDLRAELALPLALAVIPAGAEKSLAARLFGESSVAVLQHGWNHENHAPAGTPRSEFPPGRKPAAMVRAQLTEGRRRLEDLFGPRFVAALVPPFNALAGDAVDAVRASGLLHLSLATDFAGLALPSRNVHVDLIDWRAIRAVPVADTVRPLVLALMLRRFGVTPRACPIGIMTHHLVHDGAIWSLARDLLSRLKAHRNAVFAPVESIFS